MYHTVMRRDRENIPQIEVLNKTEHELQFARISQERIRLADGAETSLTTVVSMPSTRFDLVWDRFFDTKGIITEPGSQLISQSLTEELWSKKPGEKPEQYLNTFGSVASLGICPTNANWQLGAFLVKNGGLFSPDKNIRGKFDVIGFNRHDRWFVKTFNFGENGHVPAEIRDMNLGFSAPLIVKEGSVVPLEDNIGDPRLTADLRNVFNFAVDKKVPGEFWGLFRRLLPSNKVSGKRLLDASPIVVRNENALTDEEYASLETILKDTGLNQYLNLDKSRGAPRLAFCGEFPLQRLPVIGVGINKDSELIVCAADGRQKESAGLTIEELGQVMAKRGAISAGLGAAGGDVSVVAKNNSDFRVLNSPSNIDSSGSKVTRLEPSQLIFY